MKMLSAQDRSIKMESRQGPTNLVAKLMGLDALPQQEPDSVVLRDHSRCHPHNRSDVPMSYWEQQDEFFHYLDPNEHRAACEIWQQPQKSTPDARYKQIINDRKMDLVRQNFIEAKRLSVNERLRQSKQFQDALEVLNSNKDLFLKCLQEPHSMFSQNLYNRQPDSNPPETNRITILRPSKRAEGNDFVEAGNKDAKKMKRGAFLCLDGLEKVQPGSSSSSPESLKYYENSPRTTQIVVLRPTHKKACDGMAVASPHSEQPMMLQREDFFRHVDDEEDQESREVAKEIAQKMHDKFGQHCKDGNLISSVLLKDCIGDESSFNKSEHDYAGDHLCHSEAMSPVSRPSGDYVDRLSPSSTSSLSRTSYSPESSVCREAKKRLSERWAMMASKEIGQEQRQHRRSSSTLGEMLALTETKPSSSHGEEGSSIHKPRNSDFLLVSQWRREEEMDNSPRNLMRSKSVPASSGFGPRLNIGSSVSGEEESESFKEDTKVSSAKSSLKGKVSSLFLSRARKADREESLVSQTKDEFHLYFRDINRSIILGDKGSIHASPLLDPSRIASSSNPTKMISCQNGLVREKLIVSGSVGENLDQPSPISVLGLSIEEDECIQKPAPHYAMPEKQGVESPLLSTGSHLIDKSPPIGSIARRCSWNGSFLNTDSSDPHKKLSTKERDEEEQECLFFIKALLVEAGHHCEARSNSSLTRWHSLQSPLDRSLRGESIDFQDDKNFQDAKLRKKRAVQQLVYDFVNASLVDAGYDSHLCQGVGTCITPESLIMGGGASCTMLDEVWSQVKLWLSSEADDCGENDSLVVEKVIREEVVGKGWSDHFRSEMDNLRGHIEGRLLEELMQEVVVELAGRV